MRSLLLIVAIGVGFLATFVRAEERVFDFADFNRIHVSDGVSVDVFVGDVFAVGAEAVKGDIDRLEIDVDGDTLRISRDKGWQLFGFMRREEFEVTVLLPNLIAISGSSGSFVSVEGLSTEVFLAGVSSGATVEISAETLGDVELNASSGSTLDITGSCDTLTATASSGASISAIELKCAAVDLDTSSGSNLAAYGTGTAVLSASSGSSLALLGGAQISHQSSGSGASIYTE